MVKISMMEVVAIKIGDKVGIKGDIDLLGSVRLMDARGVTVDWDNGTTTIELVDKLIKVGYMEIKASRWECMECGIVFKKDVGPRTFEIKCPKCRSTDVEPA